MKILRNILWGFLITALILFGISVLIIALKVDMLMLVVGWVMAFIICYFWIAAIICAALTLGLLIYRAIKGYKTEVNQIILFIIYAVLSPVCWHWFQVAMSV